MNSSEATSIKQRKPPGEQQEAEEELKQQPKTQQEAAAASSSSLAEESRSTTNRGPPCRVEGGGGEEGGGCGVNPCVLMVALVMLLGAAYLVWASQSAIDSSSGDQLAGFARSIEAGRVASSLRHWPAAVSNHHNQGLYVPIRYGTRHLNVFARATSRYTREEEVILLVTSLPTSSFSFRSVLEFLDKETGIYAVSFDLPGLGLSDKPHDASYSTEYLAERIKDTIASMNLGKVHLVLQDYAGTVGLHFAQHHPHLVRSITLLDPGLELAVPQLAFPASLLTATADGEHSLTTGLPFVLLSSSLPILGHLNHYMWRSVFGHSFSYADYLAFSFLARYNGGKESLLRIFAERARTQEALTKSGINSQAQFFNSNQSDIAFQVLSGKENRYYTNVEEMQRRLKAALPDAPLETVAESGFLVQADQPAELSSRLATFVRSLPPSADKLHNKKLNIQAQHEAEEVLARLAAGDPSLHAHSHSHDHFDAGMGMAGHAHGHGHDHNHYHD